MRAKPRPPALDVRHNQRGFTLVELIVAIVIVGILTAVAVVGLSGVTKSSNTSSCKTMLGTAQSAAATYYANTGAYPTTFTAMTTGSPSVLTVPSGVTAAASTMSNSSWSISISGGGGTAPNTFTKTGGGTACT